MELRPFESWEEYRDCEELQRTIWGEEFAEIAPAGLMKVTRQVGGVASGAFDDGGRLVGFVYGITGMADDGRPLHWSHMLGVAPDARDRGLGLRLKEHQRALLLERGVEEARWTFDPLVARNAHFNLNRLGVEVLDYRSDMYGSSQSKLHRGLGTDRFVVAWDLASHEPPAARERGGAGLGRSSDAPPRSAREASEELDTSSPGAPAAPDRSAAGEAPPVVRIEVPADVFSVRERDPDAAADWRRRTRRAFLSRLEAGYRVTGFVPGPDRGFYVLTHPEVGGSEGGVDSGGDGGGGDDDGG